MDDSKFLLGTPDRSIHRAIIDIQYAARHMTMAHGEKFDAPDKSHWFERGMDSLRECLDILGYDVVKRPTVERLVPRQFPDDGGEAHARSMGCETPSPADPALTAAADAGYLSAADYVAAVTEAPGFDNRARAEDDADITMRG